MADARGIERVVYLGGLGEPASSKHLRSRHETAQTLAAEGPPLTYFRAAMVVGAGSESYRTLCYLVERLPVMITPAWLRTPTQPIGIEDVVEYLRAAPEMPRAAGREVQIGGPDVLSYGDMLDRMAGALGKRAARMCPVPLLTPRLSSLWIGLVTPVDADVARPLVEGLRTETVVTDPFGRRAVRRPARAVRRRPRARAARAVRSSSSAATSGRSRVRLTYRSQCAAPAAHAWELMARPQRWREWAPHVRGARGLGCPEIEPGARGEVLVLGGLPCRRSSPTSEPGERGAGRSDRWRSSTGSNRAQRLLGHRRAPRTRGHRAAAPRDLRATRRGARSQPRPCRFQLAPRS